MDSEISSKLNHIAIIMDGNGRWAVERNHQRVWGHIRGASVVSKIVEEAVNLKIKHLTLYAFSTENWSRPYFEVKILFLLLKKFLLKERSNILKNNIKFRVIGDVSNLPKETVSLIEELTEFTQENNGLVLTFAFGYGGRKEIVDGVNKFINQNPGKKLTEKDISEFLFFNSNSEVDLLIRTGGDCRISNFLLWHIAYSELYFTNTKWPDFTSTEFKEILQSISQRERRFGSIKSQNCLKDTVALAKKNQILARAETTDLDKNNLGMEN